MEVMDFPSTSCSMTSIAAKVEAFVVAVLPSKI
jgi:hypothetical protein